jgi:hypothetical protein
MDDSDRGRKAALAVRWTARVWSIVSVGLILAIVVGEIVYPHAAPPIALRDMLGLFFFPIGVCLGMVLAWRWEGLGGGITVGSLVAFYVLLRIVDGRFPRGPFFVLLAAPGALFLVSWAMTSVNKRRAGAQEE